MRQPQRKGCLPVNYAGFGAYPATKAAGFSKAVPNYTKAVAPYYGAYGKPFAKPFAKPYAKPFVAPYGKPFAKPFTGALPYTKATGYSSVVPATTVATAPSPVGFGI